MPYGVPGFIHLLGHSFAFHNARSFYDIYQEIVVNKIYEFKALTNTPYIIDCGANMGLSSLFFANNYPDSTIVAFEPDEQIFEVLLKNVIAYKLQNITAIKKAVWDSETTLEFYADNGLAGSVENVCRKQKPALVETVRLKNYLDRKVDLLKMDIEGAEYGVLMDCKDELKKVENIFIEYHSYIRKEQQLGDILELIKRAGFRYHIKESFSREKPFVSRSLICENMDMAVNIFGYRDEH
jgi:FkbM family methyltransferase